jgi:thiol-disulfide isomerase/thioredoxin
MLIAFLPAFRLRSSIGGSAYIPYVPDKNLSVFLESHNRSIVVYGPNRYLLPFMDYAITRYSNSIAFAAANTTLAPPRCVDPPCFAAYANGRDLFLPQPAFSTPLFTTFCERVLNPLSYRLSYSDGIGMVLEEGVPVLFGVGLDARPPDIPPDARFFLVSPSVIDPLVPNLTAGVYLYRPKDRQFLPYAGDFARESQTLLLDEGDNYTQREFFAGFLIGSNDTASEIEISLLNAVAPRFAGRFSFVIFQKSAHAKSVLARGRLAHMAHPFFFVFRSANVTGGRWFLRGEEAHDPAAVAALLAGVAAGTAPYSVRHSVCNGSAGAFREVNALTAEAAVVTRDAATVLLLTASWCAHCAEFRPVAAAAAEALAPRGVRVFWMDGPENDAPPFVPDHVGFPVVWLWPAGERFLEPIAYQGEAKLPDFIEWIEAHR